MNIEKNTGATQDGRSLDGIERCPVCLLPAGVPCPPSCHTDGKR